MKQTEYTQAEMQLFVKLQNIYKAETDKRIEDLLSMIDSRDKEIENLRQTIREKDERIDELTDVILGKDEPKCKFVTLRPAYAQ